MPLVAPAWMQHMPHGLHPLLESGILLTTISAVVLNMFFNGAQGSSEEEIRHAAMQAEGGH
jgi:NCS2 family nucleobase:cation symporter-2